MKMFKSNNNKGFTLIELLVVVAIIGILASVVLASLNSARSKGNDAKVKSQLASIRAAAEIYYSDNTNYGTGANTAIILNNALSTSAGVGVCNTIATDPSGLFGLTKVPSNYPSSTNVVCYGDGSAWAVAASLVGGSTGSSKAWCTDSTGASRGKDAADTEYAAITDALDPGDTVCK